jgi:hypothetical protein
MAPTERQGMPCAALRTSPVACTGTQRLRHNSPALPKRLADRLDSVAAIEHLST